MLSGTEAVGAPLQHPAGETDSAAGEGREEGGEDTTVQAVRGEIQTATAAEAEGTGIYQLLIMCQL